MQLPSFEEYQSDQLSKGCSEVLIRDWSPNQVVEEHSHPFAADALIVAGEMWLMVGQDSRHLKVGDTFHLEHNVLHKEMYGAMGATYWVARTNHLN